MRSEFQPARSGRQAWQNGMRTCLMRKNHVEQLINAYRTVTNTIIAPFSLDQFKVVWSCFYMSSYIFMMSFLFLFSSLFHFIFSLFITNLATTVTGFHKATHVKQPPKHLEYCTLTWTTGNSHPASNLPSIMRGWSEVSYKGYSALDSTIDQYLQTKQWSDHRHLHQLLAL